MRSFQIPTAAARVPALSATAAALHAQQRPATDASASAAVVDHDTTAATTTTFGDKAPSSSSRTRSRSPRGSGTGGYSSNNNNTNNTSGGSSSSSASSHAQRRGGNGGGPLAAVKYMQSMRITSPCLYLTPSTSQVTSALFYGGEGRVAAGTVANLASHVMDTTPPNETGTTSSSNERDADHLLPVPARLNGRATILGGHTRGASYWRSRQYETYAYLFQQYVDRGFTDVQALLSHPDAPSPAEVLVQMLPHRVPCALLTERALRAIVVSHTLGNASAGMNDHSEPGRASLALARFAETLRTEKSTTLLYHNRTIRVALLESLLASGLVQQAATVAEETPVSWLSPRAWHGLVAAAARGRLAHSTLLWKLLVEAPAAQPAGTVVASESGASVNTVQLPSSEFGYAAAHYIPSSNAAGNEELASRAAPSDTARVRLFEDVDGFHRFAEPLFAQNPVHPDGSAAHAWTEKEKKWMAMSFLLGARGVVFGLDGKTTAELLLRAGPAMRQQASSLLALHIMRRYVKTCELLAQEANTLQASLTTQILHMRNWQSVLATTPKTTTTTTTVGDDTRVSDVATTANVTELALTTSSASSSSSALALRHAASQRTPSLASAAMPHPSPYLAFFRIAREARDLLTLVVEEDAVAVAAAATATATGERQPAEDRPGPRSALVAAGVVRRRGGLPMLHWELVWHAFQQLNRNNPRWYALLPPEEAADLCQDVIEVLCRGADPWLSLNVARTVSARHIVDGLDMTLWLLHHLDASHHTQEAKEVTRKLYQWLLVDVGIHLHPALHHHLIPAARVLIRLGLHDDLKSFYNAVLDNVYAFSESFRNDFMAVMADLACPACSSLLADHDPYHERSCPNCMQHIPPKDVATLPSYQLSAEHIARQRERRLAQQRSRRQRSYQSAQRLGRMRESVQDAAIALFQREVLAPDAGHDRAPLLPGVAVASALPLFPLEDGSVGTDGSSSNTGVDVRTALEESYRRLDLQRQARTYALSHRGLTAEAAAAMPSSAHDALQRLASSGQAAVPQYQPHSGRRGVTAPVQVTSTDGPWVCVWCQEKNSEWASRVECTACGAETGPAAPWRAFTYAADGDAMTEIRGRIANCDERPVEAVMAAYLLMVYRRSFLLRAAPHDHERVRHLVHKLCELHERVLAGFVYTRLVPPPQRRKDENLLLLTQLFDGAVEACQKLTEKDLLDDETLFQVVFSKDTCRVCFGHHNWKLCPIVTRDFSASARESASTASASSSRISLSPEEKQEIVLKQLKKLIELAVQQGKEKPKLVVDAYAAFITSPFREIFAEVHPEDANALSITLSRFRQYRRAAFVLCHVPPYARLNEAYLAFAHYFNVTEDEAMTMLAKRSPIGHQDNTHPNFVQLTHTCCMCLDEQHPSFACPRLAKWLREAQQLMTLTSSAASSAGGRHTAQDALVDPMLEFNLQRRLKAQADGWTSAGPERLYAFYRFLLDHVGELREVSADSADMVENSGTASSSSFGAHRRRAQRHDGPQALDNPLVYAANKVVRKLASVAKDSEAFRLYAHTPPADLAMATTTALLRLQRFSDDHIRDLMYENDGAEEATTSQAAAARPSLDNTTVATRSAAARAAAVPLRQRCLICFDASHSFLQCPELAAQSSVATRLQHVVKHVGGIACSADGISGAAAYVYHTYNMGQLPHDLLRDEPELVRALLQLCERCFATGQVAAGVRVLRRLPIEMVPPLPIYTQLWRAAGLAEAAVEARTAAILALYDSENIRPSIDTPPQRPTYSAHFMSSLSRLIHDDLCRHCYESGHTLATCSVFHAEVSFGRDYVAAYRMNMMSEQLSTEWQDDYLLKLVEFFEMHRLFMPYHIAGVGNALSAIAAMWSFRGEPGIALRHLLMIPPAYRRRQAFKHLLHCLQVPAAEISRLLDAIVFVPDDVGSRVSLSATSPTSSDGAGSVTTTSSSSTSSASSSSASGNASVAQHLLIPKPAIRDIALKAVFEKVPAAMAALEECDARTALIVSRNQPPSSSSSTSAAAATSPASAPQGWGAKLIPARQVMQSGDIRRLREDFDPILSRLEDAVGMKLGSRHILFTSAVDVLGAGPTTSSPAAHTASASSASATPAQAAPVNAAAEAEVFTTVTEVKGQADEPAASRPPQKKKASSPATTSRGTHDSGNNQPRRPANDRQQDRSRRRDGRSSEAHRDSSFGRRSTSNNNNNNERRRGNNDGNNQNGRNRNRQRGDRDRQHNNRRGGRNAE